MENRHYKIVRTIQARTSTYTTRTYRQKVPHKVTSSPRQGLEIILFSGLQHFLRSFSVFPSAPIDYSYYGNRRKSVNLSEMENVYIEDDSGRRATENRWNTQVRVEYEI